MRQPDPAGPPERAARALARPVAEPLAHDQHPARRDSTSRLLAQQQEQLDRQSARTAQQLAAAQRELQRVPWWNRGRRAGLETEIALDQKALQRADEKRLQLAQLVERRARTLALTRGREHDELTPSPQPEPLRRGPAKPEREPRGLGLER